MKVIELEYYEVSYDPNTDWGGIHRQQVIGKFSSLTAANEYAKGRGTWGADAQVKHVNKAVIIYDTVEEATGVTKLEAEKKIALSKLTAKEKQILGLT